MTRIGVIGLGAMGGAVAANLVRSGFDVLGFDVEAAQVERLLTAGGAAAASPSDVAARADIVLLSLPSARAFEQVCLGQDGIRAAARPGLIVVEMSTLPPQVKEAVRQALEPSGIVLLDCPLSGTGDQAVTGDLVVFASGDHDAIRTCEPVFTGFARGHHVIGEFGAGSRMKLVANLLVSIHNVAAAEALSLAAAAGLDLEQTVAVIADSAGSSRMFEIRAPKMVHGSYGTGMRNITFQKDLAAITELAEQSRSPVPLLALCSRVYHAAAAAGHGDDDTASVYELFKSKLVSDAIAAPAEPS